MALRANPEFPPRVVFDAGPLIGAFNEQDRFHLESSRGLSQLVAARSRMLVPMAIVFEVYKWLAYRTRPAVARSVLQSIRLSFEIIVVDIEVLDDLSDLVTAMPNWPGSLEDALLAHLGRQLDAAVWTYNYRDLSAFKDLEFWTPA